MSLTRAPLFLLFVAASLGGCSGGSGSELAADPAAAGAGGSAGVAGSGGGAGGGGAGGIAPGPACFEPAGRCVNGFIDPATESFNCVFDLPPALPDACDGTESVEGPTVCPSGGEVATYQLTAITLDDDCDSGYDLDGCDGESCSKGNIAPNEGLDGVDNAVAGLANLVSQFGTNMSAINQLFYDGLCRGLDIRLSVDINSAERCAAVTVTANGETRGAAFMNVSDDGCVSGSLGTLPFTTLSSGDIPLDNVRVRVSLSPEGFADGLLGATLDEESVGSLASNAIGIAGAFVAAEALDINQSLEVDPEAPCDALSVSLKIGGVRAEPLP